jgi:hypothetical protein
VEVAGFRSNTAPRLIDVADFFIDLGDIAELVCKDSQSGQYDIPSFVPPEEVLPPELLRQNTGKNFPQVSNNIRFEPNYAEDEAENFSDLVRVTDDR